MLYEGRKHGIAIVEQLESHVGRIADYGLMPLIPDRKVIFTDNKQGLGVAIGLRVDSLPVQTADVLAYLRTIKQNKASD